MRLIVLRTCAISPMLCFTHNVQLLGKLCVADMFRNDTMGCNSGWTGQGFNCNSAYVTLPSAPGLQTVESFEAGEEGSPLSSISAADFRFSACKQTHVKRDPKRPLAEHVFCPAHLAHLQHYCLLCYRLVGQGEAAGCALWSFYHLAFMGSCYLGACAIHLLLGMSLAEAQLSFFSSRSHKNKLKSPWVNILFQSLSKWSGWWNQHPVDISFKLLPVVVQS